MRVTWLAGSILPLILLQPQNDQQARQTFKSGVDVVLLDVTVLDRNRQPVRGLRAADFTILEDGTPQAIVSLEELSAPEPDGSLVPWMREVAPDVRTNTADDRRIITLILDDANVSFRDAQTVRAVGRKIVDRLGPSDQMCVIYTAVNQKSQEFTSDPAPLKRAIERFSDSAAPFGATQQYAIQTVRRASETLLALPGRRKALIFVSTLAVDFANQNSDAGHQLRMAMEAAQESSITIFPINPAGLEVDIDTPAETSAGRTIISSSPGSQRDLANDTARYMAAETGGFPIINSNAFDQQIQQMFRETGAYYLIGFRSAHGDGRFRRIEVRTGRDDLIVRTRTRYRAPREEKKRADRRPEPRPASSAISGVLPAPDVPLRVAMAPFALPGKDLATVAIVVGVQQPAPTGGQRIVDRVELIATAFDVSTQGYRARASITQKAEIVLRPVDDGGSAKYEMLSKLDLRPGRYQVRFGVHSQTLAKAGSVFQEIEIPDFRKQPLSLSGVVLGVDPALPSAPKGYLAAVVPLSPTTQRSFSPADRSSAFLRIYQGGRKPPLGVLLTTAIVDAHDRAVHEATEALASDEFGTSRSRDVRLELPLDRLGPGAYLLRLRAKADTHEATREIRFFVRAP